MPKSTRPLEGLSVSPLIIIITTIIISFVHPSFFSAWQTTMILLLAWILRKQEPALPVVVDLMKLAHPNRQHDNIIIYARCGTIMRWVSVQLYDDEECTSIRPSRGS